jgi:hypothetical protein
MRSPFFSCSHVFDVPSLKNREQVPGYFLTRKKREGKMAGHDDNAMKSFGDYQQSVPTVATIAHFLSEENEVRGT